MRCGSRRCAVIRWGAIVEGVNGGNERCIEIPLALDFLRLDQPGWVLDAGCALNGHLPGEHVASVIHLSISLSREPRDRGDIRTSYVAADMRHLTDLFKPEAFRQIASISTIEHIGLDNTGYGAEKEACPETQRGALVQLWKLSRNILVTVPYRDEPVNHGSWRHWGPDDVAFAQSLGFEARYWGRVGDAWRGGEAHPLDGILPSQGESVHQIVGLRLVA